jgi:uncharacterized protein (DUF302 family)
MNSGRLGGGERVAGITILTTDAAGAITNIAIHQRPLPGLLRFSAELNRALAGKNRAISLQFRAVSREQTQTTDVTGVRNHADNRETHRANRTYKDQVHENIHRCRAALERTVPQLDPTVLEVLANGDVERANSVKENGPELSIFLSRDHGALLQIAGRPRKAMQYDIGNPITASLMTRHQLAAALYAPVRVVLYEDDNGHGVFEYDRPASTFGQFDDQQVSVVARELDAALERVLVGAAE